MISLRRHAPLAALLVWLAAPLAAPAQEVETFSDEVTVTATRTEQRLGDTAASVVVLSSEELAATAAPRAWSAGGDWSSSSGALSVRLSGGDQDFRQTFTAVSADRSSERLTRSQSVPSDFAGLSFQASRALGERHALVGGLDAREVRGTSERLGRPPGALDRRTVR